MNPVGSVWAKRFMTKASLSDLQTACDRENYWTVEVFDLMAERCDELNFLDPIDGLEASQILICFAKRVRDLDLSRQALAYAVLGSAFRVNSLYTQAHAAYETALKMAGSRATRGKVLQRVAVLNWAEGAYRNAFKIIEESIDLLDDHDLGVSFAIRGSLFSVTGKIVRSIEDQGRALLLLKRGSHSYFCALRNLGDSLVATQDLDAISEALKLLRRGREMVQGMTRARRKAPTAFLEWVEGRINGKLGSHNQGIKKLTRAKKLFLELGGEYFRDALLVSVDLAIVHEASGAEEEALGELFAAYEAATESSLAESSLAESRTVIKLYLDARGHSLNALRKNLSSA